MVDITEMYSSRYLNAQYLNDKGLNGSMATIIEQGTETTNLGTDQEREKVYLKLNVAPEKPLLLGVQNARALAKAFGPDTETWIGKKILLSISTFNDQGKEKEMIRTAPIKESALATNPAPKTAVPAEPKPTVPEPEMQKAAEPNPPKNKDTCG